MADERVLVVVCTLLIAAAHVLLKIAVRDWSFIPLALGVALLAIGGILLTLAFKRGDLSAIHPFLSLSFVWVLIASALLGEPLAWERYAGVAGIVIGVVLIGGSG